MGDETKKRRKSGGTSTPPSRREPDPSRTMVNRLKPNQTPAAATAEMVVAGLAVNAVTAVEFSKFPFGDVDLTECLNALVDSVERVNQGDLGEAEALLSAQATILNTIFAHLAHRAHLNLGQHLDTSERYLRLALKAQSQCRATLETLAFIKNPPAVFARQANIAHGPQQVNNGVPVARAENLESEQNKLLEAHGEGLDGRASSAAGTRDSAMVSVGTIDRPADG